MKADTRRLLVRSLGFLLYLVIGMVTFRLLESSNEQQERAKAKEAIERMRERFNISQEQMKEFVSVVTTATQFGYSDAWLERWSYLGSLFFSGTVVTTIGKKKHAEPINGVSLFFVAIIYSYVEWQRKQTEPGPII